MGRFETGGTPSMRVASRHQADHAHAGRATLKQVEFGIKLIHYRFFAPLPRLRSAAEFL